MEDGGLTKAQADDLNPDGHRAFLATLLERYGVAADDDHPGTTAKGDDRVMGFSDSSGRACST